MAKGGSNERDLCWQLSWWWTGRKDRLVFWRTSNSGGGATVRHRKGIDNKSHAGDICAIEETGRPFTDLITIEAKRGYNKTANIHTLLDFKHQTKSGKATQKKYEEWIEQAVRASERAGTKYWMLVHRRDGGEQFWFMPRALYVDLCLKAVFSLLPDPFVMLESTVRFSDKSEHKMSIVGMKWRHFLFHVDPDDIRKIHE